MCARRRRLQRRFWIRLLVIAAGCAILWPLLRGPYIRHLGATCALVAPALSHAQIRVNRVTLDDRLRFDLTVYPADGSPALRFKPAIVSTLYGLGLITFIPLVLALPAVPWRRRLILGLAGIAVLHGIQFLTVLFDLFIGMSGDGQVPWPGDYISDIMPARSYFIARDYISVLTAQIVPVLLWLVLFVYPVTQRPRKTTPLASVGRPASQGKGASLPTRR